MNGGSRIIGLQSATDDILGYEDSRRAAPRVDDHFQMFESEDDPEASQSWLVPLIGAGAALLWLAVMIWLAWPALAAGMTPIALTQFIAALCVPPALIGVLMLLALRTSRAEAARFGATAAAMRDEAAQLEQTVSRLGERLSANRAALSEQAALLVAMSDSANERLAAIGAGFAHESRTIESAASVLTRAAADAERSLDSIVASLPRAHAQTTGLTQALEATARTAGERAAALEAQLVGLAERGRIADDVSGSAANRLASYIAKMEASSQVAATRLDDVAADMSETVDSVVERAATVVDEARKGIAAQGEAMLSMLGTSHAALDRAGRDGAEALSERLGAVEDTILRIAERLDAEHARSRSLFDTLDSGISGVSGQFEQLHATGIERSRELAASISALSGSADAMTETMRIGEATARMLITTAEELLTSLDASAREIDETLPEALIRLDSHITASRQLVVSAKPELLSLVTAAESTHDAVEAVAGLVTAEREKLAQITATLTQTLDAGRDKAATLDGIVADAIAKTRRFAEDAAPQLIDALTRIRESAATAADSARDVLIGVVPDAARAIEGASAAAVRRAFDHALPQPLAELGAASEAAVTAATRASERLAHQLMTIAETTASVEARIDAERTAREESNQDNFARRVSLLIEALNSASIDITKTFSHEVTDSAWAAYLKGDRGVFTRRAVRLLDAGEAREIARLHDTDPDFRENVNRYIHDFEAMLRQILALRDGSPLGVTLLSSDMGKLYVALAQAIERLRT